MRSRKVSKRRSDGYGVLVRELNVLLNPIVDQLEAQVPTDA
jgi:hypothetical protein